MGNYCGYRLHGWFLLLLVIAQLGSGKALTTTMISTNHVPPDYGGWNYRIDCWNVPANWNNGVPNGSANAVVAANIWGVVDGREDGATTIPTYTGYLKLEANASVRLEDINSVNAVSSVSEIMLDSGAILGTNYDGPINLPRIRVYGNAGFSCWSTGCHNEVTTFSDVFCMHSSVGVNNRQGEQACVFTLLGQNGHRFHFNAATNITGLFLDGAHRYYVYGNEPRCFGSGDVTVNGSAHGRSAHLYLQVNETIADDATLSITGNGYDESTTQRITIAAGVTEVVGDLIIDGIRLANGVYGQADGFISGDGILIVQAPSTATTSEEISTTIYIESTTSTTTNIGKSGLLQCSMTLNISHAAEFVEEPHVKTVIKEIVAALLEVNISWVRNVTVETISSRRLDLLSPIADWKWRKLLDLTTKGGVKIAFSIVIPPDGGPEEVTATLLSERFDEKSLEEASAIVNKVVKSGILGSKDYEVTVLLKKVDLVQERSGVSPAPSPSSTDQPITLYILIIITSGSVITFGLVIVAFRKTLRKSCRSNESSLLIQHSASAVSTSPEIAPTKSESKLLSPPSEITFLTMCAMWDVLLHSLDFDKPLVFVCFAVGQRMTDDRLCGPGLFFAAAVIEALRKQGISCCAYLSNDEEDAANIDMLSGSTSCKMLLLVETPAVYRCRKCLEEICAAVRSDIDIVRLGFDNDMPSERKQSLDDHELLKMRMEVEAVLDSKILTPESPNIVQSVPGFLEAFALDMQRKMISLAKSDILAGSKAEVKPQLEISRVEESKYSSRESKSDESAPKLPRAGGRERRRKESKEHFDRSLSLDTAIARKKAKSPKGASTLGRCTEASQIDSMKATRSENSRGKKGRSNRRIAKGSALSDLSAPSSPASRRE